MAMRVRVVYDGRGRVLSHINKASDSILEKLAKVVVQEAFQNAPKKTGRLASEIYSLRAKEGHWRVISPTYYAAYVEFGTIHKGPRPYMRPAIERAKAYLSGNLNYLMANNPYARGEGRDILPGYIANRAGIIGYGTSDQVSNRL